MRDEARRETEGRDRILQIAERLDDSDAETHEQEQTSGWISFQLSDRSFALPITHVRGVHRAGEITPLPGSPPEVLGLTNLRGKVISVIDLGTHLALGATELDRKSRILDVEVGQRRLGLLTHRTGSLIRVRPGDVEPVSGGSADRFTAHAVGELSERNEAVILLDPDRLFTGDSGGAGTRAGSDGGKG